MRDTIFVSHANPEDNRFALWLTLRLVREGYKVWCDLTGLLGGEDFWRDIETEIRERTVKFIYVLSTVSNEKPGPRQELRIAKGVARGESLKDFVIPMRIDDLAHSAIHIELTGINVIDSHPRWAPSLVQLLEKLKRGAVPKSPSASPAVVSSWWRSKHSAGEGVLPNPEDHASSWFPIQGMPTHLWVHQPTGTVPPEKFLRYPGALHASYLISFCPAADVRDQEGATVPVGSSVTCALQSLLAEGGFGMDRAQARDVLVRLLGGAWSNMVSERRLPTYEMANGVRCAYFTEDILGSTLVKFRGPDGKPARRQLVGYRTRPPKEGQAERARRWWHFGIDARPFVHPQNGYAVGTHVLFSSDGSVIWKSKDKLHQARRILCFDWWNDAWRDRLLASMFWLAQGGTVKLSVGSAIVLGVSYSPMFFRSPVTYVAPDGSVPGLLAEEDEIELEDLDDDEEAGETAAEGEVARQLLHFNEPSLIFGYEQPMEDPRDGLTLFGPLDQGKPYGVRAGVVGTSEGIERFRRWVEYIQAPVIGKPPNRRGRVVADEKTWERAHPTFPGFEAVFSIPWKPEPALRVEVSAEEIAHAALLGADPAQRVYRTVEVYASRITRAIQEEDTTVDVWFVVIPEIVYKYCRPQAIVPPSIATSLNENVYADYLKKFRGAPSLFAEDNVAAVPYQLDLDFHHQLKARLLDSHVVTQIVRETTIAHRDFVRPSGTPTRALDGLEPDIAWHIAAATFYKLGGRPWKLAGVREGVCYIGLVFKRDHTSADDKAACCAAQMFLDSGDGLVFKGDIGPWYTPTTKQFHISRNSAKELVEKALESYRERCGGPPRELFIHGRARFDDEEWAGFSDAVAKYRTALVGIRIRESHDIKLYRLADRPILRGLAYVRDQRTAFLWTKGYTPRLGTYVGREVPNPLLIDVCRGKVPMATVLRDILGLTKINYNACRFSDGPPVTLKFADQIGEILTAGFSHKDPPLAFRYYI